MADWSYRPGELPAILTGSLALLFAGPRAAATARTVLTEAAPGDGWEAALDVMLRGGVSAVPDLFAGEVTGDTLSGLVRGDVRLTVTHRDGRATELAGTHLRTWHEFCLTEVASFTAHAGSPTPGPAVPAHLGPLAVSQLSCTVATAAPADPGLTLEFSDALFEQAPELARQPGSAVPAAPAAGRYDELFGATIHFGVEAAAVRPPDEDADDPQLREEPAAAISGIVCVAGHPNPLERDTCTRCGASLTGAAVARVPLPDLGAVLLPDGRSIPLQGTVLIGRSPRADRTAGDAIPTLVSIDDRDVSRTHVRIHVEGWQVLLEDLGSTNGTVFTAVGTGPRRVRPGEPVLVTDGAVAELGTGSRITFAGIP
ncbi:FHA domain-containing protein [Microbacterium sp. zg-YB36]|uniref:FHA domain-containing protein n=1 Tax=Microbacterium sp. zg-YB36 TaxID=2969407 RepID=UPI00214AA445|nr:FHA domain-containing protein [Microbacterium sp. zg-YB36]MDL5350824.1 FHA domain-containing protein [Microbacterium sp. zg-YB36]